MTAKARRNVTRSDILAALRHAGNPLDITRNHAYYIGIDTRGRAIEIILVADDVNADTWVCIHAMPIAYRRNI